ncbi:MAG: chlorophyll a/b-binding protein [Cyanobacteria bacterium P01_C01_bin.121]
MSAQTSQTDSSPAEKATSDGLQPGFGWTQYAEQTNGRFAMIGFIALLVLELFTRQDFFTWLGLR